ncbi:LysM peptidoglycan-binding domain-containing protein [Patescibacteria group bacterium]|nr:LysM peptidoglycan-binding domain-containing protein [Patescibacteria group bacterium]
MAESNKENPKDGLALVVGGLFVLALVFATYTYFNNSTNEEFSTNKDTAQEEGEEKGLSERIKDMFNGDDEDEKDDKEINADLNGEGAADKRTDTESDTTGTTTSNTMWTPNDYTDGDLKGNSYTVVSGDTLWEIAEARYGNGADWVKILNANSASIGYLPSGQQALINPGQVLVLP